MGHIFVVVILVELKIVLTANRNLDSDTSPAFLTISQCLFLWYCFIIPLKDIELYCASNSDGKQLGDCPFAQFIQVSRLMNWILWSVPCITTLTWTECITHDWCLFSLWCTLSYISCSWFCWRKVFHITSYQPRVTRCPPASLNSPPSSTRARSSLTR